MSEDKMVKNKAPRAEREEEILKFWKENDIFSKTLQKDSPSGEFVFYEGPPTANGRPGIHHLESRAFKDAIPRYKTMRGYHVRRKGGWDTHGLPVEIEVEKELGLRSKKEIVEYGLAKFNNKCKENVWKYVNEWEKFTERAAYWTDQDNPYVTYYPDYMETLWWIIGEVHKKDLLYKDYKVLPWCPRCETALATHELAQGYKDVKDLSITAKFEFVDEPGVFVLAWTTTPWTLPGNVALAVGEDIEYVKIKQGEEFYILAEKRLEVVSGEYEVIDKIKGKDLAGKSYKPLFSFLQELISDEQKPNLEKAYQIYVADFVTTEDGTGVVHTAVMYGQDDFALGNKIGLPKHHLVDQSGNFVKGTGFLEGKFVKEEETEVSILKDLAARGLLFSKKKYEHSYPFCWRCKTPLIYFARDSWYIRMTALQSELIEENKSINWEPAHLKNGRFGEWLDGIRDWAISRERYWGTPLPIWMSEDNDMLVISSFDDLRKYTKKSGNKYFVMRHGEADSNVQNVVSDVEENPDHVTEKGKVQVKDAIENLKKNNIDLIISSPFVRTKETAEMVAEGLGISKSEIVFDIRIREIRTGGFDSRSVEEYHNLFKNPADRFIVKEGGGENLRDVKKRMGEFLYEVEEKYKDKNVLIVTHGAPSWMIVSASKGLTRREMECHECIQNPQVHLKNAEVVEMDFTPVPHNEEYERDLHIPYVDNVVLYKDEKEYRRVSEVMDVWFDSGAMPFAQDHYPFENKDRLDNIGFPADYISEAIDQTRGWFYTLHAIGALLGRGKAYKNVISLGLLLDAEGKKMSKSLGNGVNPFDMMDKYGADTLRMWMYGVNQPGDSKNFDEKTVDEVSKKVLNLLENVVKFYEMYRDDSIGFIESTNPLDVWIIARLSTLRDNTTNYLDNYKLLEPAREIREFIGDLSQWYIRRSRDRFKGDDVEDKNYAIATTRFVLLNLSKIMAPLMPFSSDDVYKVAGGEKESVHLEDWCDLSLGSETKDIEKNMKEVRDVVSLALEARTKTGIKVRQPLPSLTIPEYSWQNQKGLVGLIKDEINVKEVIFAKDSVLELDTNLTDELVREGLLRELMRNLQKLRKEKGLNPEDLIDTLTLEANEEGVSLINEFENELKKQVRVKNISMDKVADGADVSVNDLEFKAVLS